MITYEEAKNALLISDIDQDVARQPSLQAEIGEQLALAESQRDALKEDLATIDAEIYGEIMEADPKKADAKIKALVLQDTRHTQAFDRYLAAKLEAAKWEALYEAFKQRGFMLSRMVDLFLANHSTPSSVTRPISDNQAAEIRAKMSELRRRVSAPIPTSDE
jgi:hypothetical protein